MKSLSMLIVLGLLLAAPAARAEAPTLTEAKQLYLAAEFEDAIARLEQVVTTIEARTKDDRRELADAYLYLGLSYSALGDDDKSRDAFRKLLAVDPKRTLDTATFAPKVVALFDQARASLPPPPGPTQRPPEPRFGVELAFYAANLGEGRLRPHDHLIYPYRNELGGYGILTTVHQPVLPLTRWTAYAAVGPRSRIEVDYSSADENHVEGRAVGRTFEQGTANLTYESRHRVDFKSLDVRLSKVWKSTGALVLRRQIGYRFLSADQRIDETVDFQLAGQSGSLRAESDVRAHGLRVGLDADVRLSRRFNLDMRVGFTAFVAGHDRGRDDGSYSTTLYSLDNVPEVVTQQVATAPYRHGLSVASHVDGLVRLRLNLGQGLYLSQSLRTEGGPYVYGLGFGKSLSMRGAELSVGWRFGSPRKK